MAAAASDQEDPALCPADSDTSFVYKTAAWTDIPRGIKANVIQFARFDKPERSFDIRCLEEDGPIFSGQPTAKPDLENQNSAGGAES